jgi:hypothetical protein
MLLPPRPLPLGVRVCKSNVIALWGGGGSGGAGEEHAVVAVGPTVPSRPVREVCIEVRPFDHRRPADGAEEGKRASLCGAWVREFCAYELCVCGAGAELLIPDALKVLVDPPRVGSHYVREDLFPRSSSFVSVRVLGPRSVTTEEELDVHYHGVVVSCEPWSLEFLNLGRYDDPHAGVRTLHAGDVVCVRPGVAWQWKNNSKSVRT